VQSDAVRRKLYVLALRVTFGRKPEFIPAPNSTARAGQDKENKLLQTAELDSESVTTVRSTVASSRQPLDILPPCRSIHKCEPAYEPSALSITEDSRGVSHGHYSRKKAELRGGGFRYRSTAERAFEELKQAGFDIKQPAIVGQEGLTIRADSQVY
jgi:hypothetical protein